MSSHDLEFPNITLALGRQKKRGSITISGTHVANSTIEFRPSNSGLSNTPSVPIKVSDISTAVWNATQDGYQLKCELKKGANWVRFTGFRAEHHSQLDNFFRDIGKALRKEDISTKGANWGQFVVDESTIKFSNDDKLVFELPLSFISQTSIQGRNEVAFEFLQDEKQSNSAIEALCEMRVWCPEDPSLLDEDGEQKDENLTPAVLFQREVSIKGDVGEASAAAIASFDLPMHVPRGRYSVDLFPNQLKLHSKTFNYKIAYKTITRMFLLENKTAQHHLFVIGLNPPIRQGRTAYPYLVIQYGSLEETRQEIKLDDAKIEEKYKGLLRKQMIGLTYDIVSRVFKAITGKKVIVPGGFKSRAGSACLRTSLKANDGYLFVLEKSFFFVKKPPTYIRHNQIAQIAFDRVGSGEGASTKTFEMKIITNEGDKQLEYSFASINRDEYDNLYSFCVQKKLNVMTSEISGSSSSTRDRARERDYSEDPYMNAISADNEAADEERTRSASRNVALASQTLSQMGDLSDESGDEDFKASESDSGSGSSSESDSDMAEEADTSEDDAPKKNKKKEKAKKKKSESEGSGEEEEEAQSKKKKKKEKKEGPKRGKTSFLYFCDAKRAEAKEKNPTATVAELAKVLGEMWKKLTPEEKKPFEAQAEVDKARYEKEKESFVPEGGSEKTPAKKKRKKADDGRPPNPPSAFNLFARQMRPKLASENPELGKQLGKMQQALTAKWKELSDDDKQTFVEMHTQEKVKYKKLLAEWEAKNKTVMKADEMEEDAANDKTKKKDKEADKDKKKDKAEKKDQIKKEANNKKDKSAPTSKTSTVKPNKDSNESMDVVSSTPVKAEAPPSSSSQDEMAVE